MNSKLPTRNPNDERIALQLPAEEKRRVFEVAAHRKISTSQFIRQAINSAIANDNADSPQHAA